MIADPKVKRNGGCAVCGKPRHPERSRQYGKDAGKLDPFCSTACCRKFHGNPCPKMDGTFEEEDADDE